MLESYDIYFQELKALQRITRLYHNTYTQIIKWMKIKQQVTEQQSTWNTTDPFLD